MSRGIVALGLLACSILTVLIYQMHMPRHEPLLPRRALAPPYPLAETPEPSSAEAAGSTFAAVLLARPLFRPGRRPYDAPVDAGDVAGEGEPRLAGVLVAEPGEAAAIFAQGERSEVVRVGERIGAWTLVSVLPGEAIVDTPEGRKRLTPRFDGGGPVPVEEAAPAPHRGPPWRMQR